MGAESTENTSGLRIVTFNVEPPAYQLVAEWAARHGHELVLVVTAPGRPTSPYDGYREIVAMVPRGQDVLVTTRLRRAAPLIAALAPDLVLSYTFPYRIPPEVTAIPRCGAVNLHPSPLPRYRGPNPARMLYDGEPTLGATLHRIDIDFDTGPILARHERPLPADASPERVVAGWREVLVAALEEGVTRAAAGDPGIPQDDSLASYAAPFTEEERWLNWDDPAALLQRRTTALNLVLPLARATIDGRPYAIHRVCPLAGPPPCAPPGTLLDRTADALIVRAADAAVEVLTTPL